VTDQTVYLLHFKAKDKLLDSKKRQDLYSKVIYFFLRKRLNLDFKKIDLYKDKNRKPFLTIDDKPVSCSISHCNSHYFIGICFDQKIGIDIEDLDQKRNYLKIAKKYFSASEYKLLQEVSKEKQSSRFFLLWTAKESLLKILSNDYLPRSKDLFLDQLELLSRNRDLSYFLYLDKYLLSVVRQKK